MWDGPSTDSWKPGAEKPVNNAKSELETWFADEVYELAQVFNPEYWGDWWTAVVTNSDEGNKAFEAKWEPNNQQRLRDEEEYKIRTTEWENNTTRRQAMQAGATEEDLEALAEKHAKASPGAWNPFSGKFNPPVKGREDESPYPSRVAGNVDQNARDILSGFQLESGFKRKDQWTTYNNSVQQDQESTAIETSYASAGLGSSALKESAAQHAKQYPGEYNPFSRKVNPWPKSNKIVSDKGIVTLKTQAQIHAAIHPGEYNPYNGQVNPAGAVDKKLADALKNKKTRKALGEEHARLYPGEFNPYTETVNPMFDKDSKKGTKDIRDKAVGGGGMEALRQERNNDRKRYEESLKAAPGTSKNKPIYAQIVNPGAFGGGIVKGYAAGGLIPGKSPQNPSVDNLLASGPGGIIGIRSGEFIQSQPAVQYYGLDFMNAINNMQIPRYASGGMIGTVGGGGGTTVVELSSSAVMQIMSLANRPVNLYSDDRQIASSANRGNMLLAMRGSN
jgi:hypothetical protein